MRDIVIMAFDPLGPRFIEANGVSRQTLTTVLTLLRANGARIISLDNDTVTALNSQMLNRDLPASGPQNPSGRKAPLGELRRLRSVPPSGQVHHLRRRPQ